MEYDDADSDDGFTTAAQCINRKNTNAKIVQLYTKRKNFAMRVKFEASPKMRRWKITRLQEASHACITFHQILFSFKRNVSKNLVRKER